MSDLFSGLANLTKQVTSNISTYEIRKITEKVQGMVMHYTETENLVREATNEDPWGPTGPQMKEISNLTFQYDGFQQIMPTLWKRMLEDNKFAWKRVYKSLTLLDYLLQHGSERVITNARDHVFQMRSLEHYKFLDEKGKDQGVNIRHRACIILEMLGDDDKLRAARKKAKGDNKDRYQGYTSEDIRMGRGGDYNGGSSSSSSKRYDDDFQSGADKTKSSFDDDVPRGDYSHKEVNSFQFPNEGRRNSVSPELGFRQETVVEGADDGFGDFAQSRTAVASIPQAQTAGLTRAVDIPVLAPPGGSNSKVVAAPIQNVDLLGFLNEPAPTATPISNDIDFFSAAPLATSASPAISTVVRPPRPPSGGAISPTSTAFGSSTPSAQPTLIDDIFGVTSTTSQPAVQNTEVFTPDWTLASATMAPSPAAPTDFSTGSSATTFDVFGSFTPSSTSDVVSPTTVSGLQDSNKDKQPTSMKQTKIGSTWAGTSGLIDLDNLGTKTAAVKQSPSLNQMQRNNKGSADLNMHW